MDGWSTPLLFSGALAVSFREISYYLHSQENVLWLLRSFVLFMIVKFSPVDMANKRLETKQSNEDVFFVSSIYLGKPLYTS